MTSPSSTTANPALAALGDRLESAASTAVASGGIPPSGRSWAKLALVPALALFVVAGLIIASVVPGGSGDSAEAAIISAARQTSERTTGRFEAKIEAGGAAALAGGTDTLTLTSHGAYDADQGLFSASLDTSQVLGSIPGGESLGDVGPTIDAVIAGNDVYLDVSPLASVLGAEWLKVTLPEIAGEQGLPSVVDPGAVLDALEGAGADMGEVGREEVRGVETTHYAGSISLREAFDSIPAEDRASLEQALGGVLDSIELPDLPTDVWVDDDGLVRRVEMSVDSSAFGVPGLEQAGSIVVSVEFFDIGEDVAIEIPNDEETVAVDELTPEGLLDNLGELGLGEGFDLDSMMDELEGLGLDDLDLGSMMDELEGLGLDGLEDLEGLDLESMMEELEEYFGGGTSPSEPGGPAEPTPDPVPGSPSTTVTA